MALKIGFYSPYLDSLGGGERYTLSLASHWSRKHRVDIFWNDENIKDEAKNRLNIDLSNTKIVHNIFRGLNLLNKLKETYTYDLIFFLSDGSVSTSLAKQNIIHFQSPFPRVNGRSVWNTLKLTRFVAVICNSRYTKKYIDDEYHVNSLVIYPPVATDDFRSSKKQNIILSVGRFSKYFINKKQKEMIEMFGAIHQKYPSWELVFVGGVLPQDELYVKEIRQMAEKLPIRILPNEPFDSLKKLYGQASLYWHAAGLDENLQTNPAGAEHFGITTVEAMASGCIPIVFDAGGQREIVKEGRDGFLCKGREEFVAKTRNLIENTKLREELSGVAIARAKDFDESIFYRSFDELLARLIKG